MHFLFYEKDVFIFKKTKYIEKIRSIIYAIIKININILFTILMISYFSKNLELKYFGEVNQILKYLAKN